MDKDWIANAPTAKDLINKLKGDSAKASEVIMDI